MNREAALRQLMQTVQDDLQAYQQLHGLLEAQFAAALGHDPQQLQFCADAVFDLGARMQQRQQQRLDLVRLLAGPSGAISVSAVLERLPEPLRGRCLAAWQVLVLRIEQSRALNLRNGEFFMQQQERISRVMHGESDVYHAR